MDFMIVPVDQPDWFISDTTMRQKILERWPDAEFFPPLDASPMIMTAEVSFPQGALQMSLNRDGTMISIDAPDVEAAANFAVWWSSEAPGFEPDLRIYVTADFNRSVRLSRHVSRDLIIDALSAK